jgi:exopolysaccharide biosynthesis polyprenyl glycosylphosphotransferase
VGIGPPVARAHPALDVIPTRDLLGRRQRALAPARTIRMAAVMRLVACVDVAAALLGIAVWLGARTATGRGLPGEPLLIVALPWMWLGAMALAGAYDRRVAVTGADAFRRIATAAAWLAGAGALLSFALDLPVGRDYVIAAVPLCAVMSLGVHVGARKLLHRRFASGQVAMHQAVAVGSTAEVADLVAHLHRAAYAGFRIVAAWVPPYDEGELPTGLHRLRVGDRELARAAADVGADTIALAGPHVLTAGRLRELSWELEGGDVDLVVVPAVTDLAGPRIHVRPVDGLPLLHVERPQFTGAQRVVKSAIDRVAAALLLLLLSPLFAAVALSVRVLGGAGPVLFRQTRVGQRGEEFTIYKFRTMRSGADAARAALRDDNDADGVLFKLRRDPRVTAVGRHLRRWSLDELPQLWNVLTGTMSLVGPRPPLADEVERYEDDARRRLLVKPGLTGLWQVSGRSDLPWSECVRLDLYYIENWSVALDMLVLWKTLRAVLGRRGAY